VSEYVASLQQQIVQKDKELREQDELLREYRKQLDERQFQLEEVKRLFFAANIHDFEERKAWDRFAAANVRGGHGLDFAAKQADELIGLRRLRFGSPLAQRVKRPE
jgi:hypothetical protein